jgi:hypothetical protein
MEWCTPSEAFIAFSSATTLLVSFCEFEPLCIVGIRPRGHFVLQSFPLTRFFEKQRVEPCHAFLIGRVMVLSELLVGQFEWGTGIPFAGFRLGLAGDRLRILDGWSI